MNDMMRKILWKNSGRGKEVRVIKVAKILSKYCLICCSQIKCSWISSWLSLWIPPLGKFIWFYHQISKFEHLTLVFRIFLVGSFFLWKWVSLKDFGIIILIHIFQLPRTNVQLKATIIPIVFTYNIFLILKVREAWIFFWMCESNKFDGKWSGKMGDTLWNKFENWITFLGKELDGHRVSLW